MIHFTINGNNKDAIGNAVPKLKMTGRQHWTIKAHEYVRWKSHVQAAYLDALREQAGPDEWNKAKRRIATGGKPIDLGDAQARMDLVIGWKDNHHGDPENIFGSIADALFHNDKNLYGSFSPSPLCGKGYVDVTISVSTPSPSKARRITKTISE